MFKNPLKYASGGATPQQEQQIIEMLDAAAKNIGIDAQTLMSGLDQIKDTKMKETLIQALPLAAKGDAESINTFKKIFGISINKHGGKIQDFICKHGRGGVAGCDCEKPVEKHQQENGKGRGIIGNLSGLYNRFIGQRMPDVPGVNNRRVRTWTDANGIQHIVEDANVNGNSTVTTIDINGADTLGTQKIITGDGRYRMVNLQPGTPQWRSVMSRNVPQQENGGKVEKAQPGKKLSTPVSTTPADSSKVERYVQFPGRTDSVVFIDTNGNKTSWTRHSDGTFNWRSGNDRMDFNPNQTQGFVPYSRFKQWNTATQGSTYMSPEHVGQLNRLFDYAKNRK